MGFVAALEEAKLGAEQGGMPVCDYTICSSCNNIEVLHKVGAAIVSKNGQILGRGHNMRVQNGSAILHVCFS